MKLLVESLAMNHDHRLLELSEGLSGESFVLLVQDAVLTPGMHALNVSTLRHGRRVFSEILTSLPVCPVVGFLSNAVSVGFVDIVDELLARVNGDEDCIAVEILEEYLLYELSVDVIVIEVDPLLVAKPWFGDLYSLLGRFYATSPIIIMYASGH